MKKDLRVIFMGTPDFAVETLQTLVENKINIVAVITASDKPSGRGLKLTHSPVKEYALQQNIPVLQPTNLKSEHFLEELKSYKANLQVVVAFRMLPEVVWSMPEFGTFNIHASLLPQYRGAAPINWAIINGEKETGVTSFFLRHAIDTGDVIYQEKIRIEDHDNIGTLYEKLKIAGAQLALKTIKALESGNVPRLPQPLEEETLKHAPKIYKETCQINWEIPAGQIQNLVRGLSPYPAAWTNIQNKNFKIFEVQVYPDQHYEIAPGQIVTDNKTYLDIQALPGVIRVLELQMEGKKRMKITDFLRGFNFDII